ncbi:uncharacterized protein BCR38DRAFT_443531 [Pseudomassariella vexata]|uniref:Uncharacterized protein n=1 Tax=Pseudomassariella vexata TaxID=1141098 RepID=A0A1Y2DLF8_9PEZI|nr:uncharacterized protein BCR38DRAFT_443531 [Pseudomassariella vexata]ORY59989.1 hypothetical protein BCR38DRAFT_443531 [Pseudomassariella vexata]
MCPPFAPSTGTSNPSSSYGDGIPKRPSLLKKAIKCIATLKDASKEHRIPPPNLTSMCSYSG